MREKILMLLSAVLLVCLFCIPVSAKSATINGKTVSQVVPNNGTQTMNYSYDSTQSSYLGITEDGFYKDYGIIIPVKISGPGVLYTTLRATTQTGTEAILYTDSNCTKEYKYTGDQSGYTKIDDFVWKESSTVSSSAAYIAQAGTYYVKIFSETYYDYSEYFSNTGSLAFRFVSSAGRTLTSGKATTAFSPKNGIFYKITVPSDGYINLTESQKDGYSLKTRLYNSSKKVISNTEGYLLKSYGFTNTYKVKKGTYYVLAYGNYNFEYSIKYTFQSTINASNNKVITLRPANKNQTEYVKIKASKTGYITLTSYDYAKNSASSASVQLCNSKKSALSDTVGMYSYSKYSKTAVFAVKKNQVYYIKVNATSPFKFKYAISGVSEKSGSKASKAVSLKKGKTAAGTILPADNTTDYYKFTLSKAAIVNLAIKGKVSSGEIKVEIYSNKKCSSKYYVGSALLSGVNESYKLTSKGFSTNNKLSKGTYYIKVVRKNAKTNGYYSVQWCK